MLAQYAKASDPGSGGRQMPGHYSSAEHNLVSVSSPVATQILHAVGIALAAKIRGTDQVAMAIMGEGSSNQGDVHEALNFAAIHRLPFMFIVENNGYAISVPVERQVSVRDVAMRAAGYGIPGVVVDGTDVLACYAAGREAVDRARSGGGPTLIEAKVTRLTAHSSDDQQTKYRSEDDLAEGRAHDPLPIFRAQLREAGRADGRDRGGARGGDRRAGGGRDGLRRGGAGPGPGDGHGLGLRRCRRQRGAAAVAPGAGRRQRGARLMAIRTFIEAIRDGMAEEMRRDPSVIVLGEDVGRKGGVFLATDGLWAEFGDDRVIDTPLTESMIVGASIGAALNGLRPIAEIQFADFIFPAFNQIVSEAARMRYRSLRAVLGADGDPRPVRRRRPRRAVPLAVRGGVLHPRPGPQGGDPVDAVRREGAPALGDPGRRSGAVPRAQEDVPVGPRRRAGRATTPCRWAGRPCAAPGRQVTVVAYGLMAHYALEAAERVAGEGIDVEVVDLRTLRPLDRETLLSSVRKTGKCLVVYEDNRFGGYGAEIAAIVAEEAFDYLDGPVSRIAGPDVPAMPYNHVLEDWFMLSPVKIADAIRKLAAY